jgi:predicted nucleotidyltransferase component of viral defense system
MHKPDISFLSEHTLKVFETLSRSQFISKFTLVGGTALSLQLSHRLSEDLDFILDEETLNLTSIKRKIHVLFPVYRILKEDKFYQIDFSIEGVKVTFFSAGAVLVSFKSKDHSFRYHMMNIATTEIIAVLKLGAISQRNTIRDYYDLYFISKYSLGLKQIIERTKQLMPNLSPVTYSETLIYTVDLSENSISEHLQPKEIITKEEISDYFITELKKIRKEL